MVTTLDKNTALVLVDLQKAIVNMPNLTHPIGEVLGNSAKLVAAFRNAGLPIVIVTVDMTGARRVNLRKEFNPIRNFEFKPEMMEVADEIETKTDDIFITKYNWGAFYDTPLDEELKKRGVTGIVIGGVATSIGVEATARGANERGYNIAFAQDAMTDMFPEAHERSLKYIFPRMGEIDTTDSIVAMLGL